MSFNRNRILKIIISIYQIFFATTLALAVEYNFQPHSPDFHARLGVPSTATRQEIKAAYKAAVRRFHPDLVSSPTEVTERTAAMKNINEAFAILEQAQAGDGAVAAIRIENGVLVINEAGLNALIQSQIAKIKDPVERIEGFLERGAPQNILIGDIFFQEMTEFDRDRYLQQNDAFDQAMLFINVLSEGYEATLLQGAPDASALAAFRTESENLRHLESFYLEKFTAEQRDKLLDKMILIIYNDRIATGRGIDVSRAAITLAKLLEKHPSEAGYKALVKMVRHKTMSAQHDKSKSFDNAASIAMNSILAMEVKNPEFKKFRGLIARVKAWCGKYLGGN